MKNVQSFKVLFLGVFCLIAFNYHFDVYASDGVAKVVIKKGDVFQDIGGKSVLVDNGAWLKEGTALKTGAKSFVKLLFIDKSQLNLGPESQMLISKFPKDDAGIINLVQGKLRSQVTKDYMDIKGGKDKSKLFIKTKTAAMGVRGTDFRVEFNQEQNSTALITFSGAVAIVQLRDVESVKVVDQKKLEALVSSKDAVIVKKGEFAGANPKQERVTPPIKVSPAQMESMKKDETFQTTKNDSGKKDDSSVAGGEKSKFRNPIPPGVDGKTFTNTSSLKQVVEQVASVVGKETVKEISKEAGIEAPLSDDGGRKLASVEGSDAAGASSSESPAGEVFGARPGGIIVNGEYIQPPKGSMFDPATNTYVMEGTVGKGGDFVLPSEEKLQEIKKELVQEYIKVVAVEMNKERKASEDGKSTANTGTTMPTALVFLPPPMPINEVMDPSMMASLGGGAFDSAFNTFNPDTNFDAIADKILDNVNQDFERTNPIDNIIIRDNTITDFKFNIK